MSLHRESDVSITLANVGVTAPTASDGFQNLNSGASAGGKDYSDGGGLGQFFTLAAGYTYAVNSYSLMFSGHTPNPATFTGTWRLHIRHRIFSDTQWARWRVPLTARSS